MQICVYMHRIELAKIAYKSEFFLHSVRQNVIENSKTMENWPKIKRRQKMKTKMKNEKIEKWKKNRSFWKKPRKNRKFWKFQKISKNSKILFFLSLFKINGRFWKNLKFSKKFLNSEKNWNFWKKIEKFQIFSNSINYTLHCGKWRGNGNSKDITQQFQGPRTEYGMTGDST